MCLEMGGRKPTVSLCIYAMTILSLVIVSCTNGEKNIQSEKFKFPGHSEYFAKKTNSKDFLMMMVSEKLKVGVLTGHIPIKFISKKLSK